MYRNNDSIIELQNSEYYTLNVLFVGVDWLLQI